MVVLPLQVLTKYPVKLVQLLCPAISAKVVSLFPGFLTHENVGYHWPWYSTFKISASSATDWITLLTANHFLEIRQLLLVEQYCC